MNDIAETVNSLYSGEHLDNLNQWWKTQIMRIPSELPVMTIWEHAEAFRVMPPGTPRPGKFEIRNFTPYWIEVLEHMSPFSPVRHEVIMKGHQIGFSVSCIEPMILYYMGYDPADIMMMSATDELLRRWASRNLEPAITSYGYRDIIAPVAETKNSRRQGDNVISKEYLGCRLDLVSAGSPAGMRGATKRILIRDEVDGVKRELSTGEGNWLDVSAARTSGWDGREKILDGGTPTTYDESSLWPMYEALDQRRYFVPCPKCRKLQILSTERMEPVWQNGEITDAVHKCEHCSYPMKNHEKTWFLSPENGARWIPTKTISNKKEVSRQISSHYAPVGLMTWAKLYREYLRLQNMPGGMRSFTNLFEGFPYREHGARPNNVFAEDLTGDYSRGTVPVGVLYLVMGCDVQKGTKNDPYNPPRIEYEIVGIGEGYRTWSIDEGAFIGEIDDAFSGAWERFYEWAHSTGMRFPAMDGRDPIEIKSVFIDSGYGAHDINPGELSVVYQFCQRFPYGFHPTKGQRIIKRRMTEGVDPASGNDFRRYRASRQESGVVLYNISTVYYKTRVYSDLTVKRDRNSLKQRPHFCDFPRDYSQAWFDELTAEERRDDGSFFCPKNRRNEALDCRVSALCAADVWLDAFVLDLKAEIKRRGGGPSETDAVSHSYAIDLLKMSRGLSENTGGGDLLAEKP